MLLCICDKCGAPATNKFVYSYHLEIDSVGYVDKDFNRVSGRTVEKDLCKIQFTCKNMNVYNIHIFQP